MRNILGLGFLVGALCLLVAGEPLPVYAGKGKGGGGGGKGPGPPPKSHGGGSSSGSPPKSHGGGSSSGSSKSYSGGSSSGSYAKKKSSSTKGATGSGGTSYAKKKSSTTKSAKGTGGSGSSNFKKKSSGGTKTTKGSGGTSSAKKKASGTKTTKGSGESAAFKKKTSGGTKTTKGSGGTKSTTGTGGTKNPKGGGSSTLTKKTGKESSAKLAKTQQRLTGSRKRRMERLGDAGKARVKKALARAKADQKAKRRPSSLGTRPRPRKQTVKNPSGPNRTRFRAPKGTATALKGLGNKALANKIIRNQRLNATDRNLIRNQIRQFKQKGTLTLKEKALLNALISALRWDLWRWRMYWPIWWLGPGGGGGWIPLGPGGTIDDPGNLVSDGGDGIEPPPGVDPGGPAGNFPNQSGDPTGPGLLGSLDPGSVDPGQDGPGEEEQGEEAEEAEEGEEGPGKNVDSAPLDSVLQRTRFLRVSNATQQKLRIYIRYQTVTDSDDMQWFPAKGGDPNTLTLDLDAGEVCDVMDGDWRVNASRVRIWAEGEDETKARWMRFKSESLWLVPEVDADDNHVYAFPRIQTFTVAFR